MENGEKQYLTRYDDPGTAPAYMAEDVLPRELTAPYNPSQDVINAMPAGEGSIEFDWVKQEYIGKFGDQVNVFVKSKWQDKEEGAIKAARNWLQGLRS